MADEMIFHHTACGQLALGQVLTPGQPCPKCRKPVPASLVTWTCNCGGKSTTWRSDLDKEVGDSFVCPIHDKLVVVVSKTQLKAQEVDRRKSRAELILWVLLIALLAVVVRDTWGTLTFTPPPPPTFTTWPTSTFTPWPTSPPTVTPTPTATATWTPTPTPWFVPPECDVALLFGQMLDGLVVVLLVALFIGILYLLFKATAWLAGRPAQTLEQLDRLTDDAPVRSIADESRRTIQEQNDWVSGLLVLVIAVAAWCRLDADSFAQMSDAVRQMVVQRTPAILILSILLAAIPFYQELSGTSILANVPLAAFVSGMFGVGSVTTVIAAPLLFGAAPGEVAMTELAINAVVDICLNFQRARLRQWYGQMRWRE